MTARVLVIDDDPEMCRLIRDALCQEGYEVEFETRGADGIDALKVRDYDVVLSDLKLKQMSGLAVCEHVATTRPDIPVIVITAFGTMEAAIGAVRAGAFDFVNKPLDMRELAHRVGKAAEHRSLNQSIKRLTGEIGRGGRPEELVGESGGMKKVYELIHRIADSDASVLITGESGTGKELVARALHRQSGRADRRFVAINCAAVPANLLESELFGHARGAFTDARTARQGLFEQAHGGTVLLDEIGEMPLDMQPKLLRALQERTVRPLGTSVEMPFDARVIAATNRDLESDVEEGRFREDLFYRINVVEIHVPPLRARGNDILLLAQLFTNTAAERHGKPIEGILPEAAKMLLRYDWPGNVRQLENCIERAVALARFDHISPEDLPDGVREFEDSKIVLVDADAEHLLTLAELERRYIERVLVAVGGNKTQAAKVLGVDRRTLYRKLERHAERSR